MVQRAIYLGVALVALLMVGAPIAGARNNCPDGEQYETDCRNDQLIRELGAWLSRTQVIAGQFSSLSVLATTYRVDRDDVFVIHGPFPPGSSQVPLGETAERQLVVALTQLLARRRQQGLRLQSVEIVGHTDLEQASGQVYDAHDGTCQARKIETRSLECLGITRALFARRLYETAANSLGISIDAPRTSYDDDFFMGSVNRKLFSTLYLVLGVVDEVVKLKSELGISETYIPAAVRADVSIHKKISTKQDTYRALFSPFRSVVLIIRE